MAGSDGKLSLESLASSEKGVKLRSSFGMAMLSAVTASEAFLSVSLRCWPSFTVLFVFFEST